MLGKLFSCFGKLGGRLLKLNTWKGNLGYSFFWRDTRRCCHCVLCVWQQLQHLFALRLSLLASVEILLFVFGFFKGACRISWVDWARNSEWVVKGCIWNYRWLYYNVFVFGHFCFYFVPCLELGQSGIILHRRAFGFGIFELFQLAFYSFALLRDKRAFLELFKLRRAIRCNDGLNSRNETALSIWLELSPEVLAHCLSHI